MDSVRISIINHDLSTTTVAPATPEYKGFTVVSAPKGPVKPILIDSVQKLHDTFGYPSAEYPELYEVEAFINAGYPAYVSAPYNYGKEATSTIPVAYLTKDAVCIRKDPVQVTSAVEKLIAGDNSVKVPGITVLPKDEPVNVLSNITLKNNGFNKVYNYYGTNEGPAFYTCVDSFDVEAGTVFRVKGFGNDDSIYFDVKVGSVVNTDTFTVDADICGSYKVTSSDGNVGYTLINSDSAEDGVGYIVFVNDNQMLFIFTGSSTGSHIWNTAKVAAYVNDSTYTVSELALYEAKSVDSKDIYATIYAKHVETNGIFNVILSGHSSKPSNSNILATANRLNVSCNGISFEGSLAAADRLESGASLNFYSKQSDVSCPVGLYVINSFEVSEESSNNYISKLNKNLVNSYSIQLDGGVREEATNRNAGWKYALEEKFHDVNIFFDPEVHFSNDALDSYFCQIASEDYHPLAGCIFNKVPFEKDVDLEIITAEDLATISPLTYGPNYWNICNVGKKSINGKYEYLALTGVRAASQMQILKDSYGGIAPMYTGVSQIPSGHVDGLLYEFNKKAQLILDENNYNAVLDGRTTNNNYGFILASHKTCKSGELTDWSYIGHVASFLQFEREIRDNVMFPQIGKANNEYYRSLRKYQAEEILRKRVSGSNPIWAEGIVDTSTNPGVNDIAAQKARKFIINVRVKVNVFSEWVELNFTNVAQDMTV